MDSWIFPWVDEADQEIKRLRAKHIKDPEVEVTKTQRMVRAKCAVVNVWMVVARKPWKE